MQKSASVGTALLEKAVTAVVLPALLGAVGGEVNGVGARQAMMQGVSTALLFQYAAEPLRERLVADQIEEGRAVTVGAKKVLLVAALISTCAIPALFHSEGVHALYARFWTSIFPLNGLLLLSLIRQDQR